MIQMETREQLWHESTRDVARVAAIRFSPVIPGLWLAQDGTGPVALIGFLAFIGCIIISGPYVGETVDRAFVWWHTREY